MRFNNVDPESPDYIRPKRWVYDVAPISDVEADGLYAATHFFGRIDFSDRDRVIKQLSYFELLKVAAERIRGAGVSMSLKPEDVGADFAVHNQREIDQRSSRSFGYNLFGAVVVHGATQEQFTDALESVISESAQYEQVHSNAIAKSEEASSEPATATQTYTAIDDLLA